MVDVTAALTMLEVVDILKIIGRLEKMELSEDANKEIQALKKLFQYNAMKELTKGFGFFG